MAETLGPVETRIKANPPDVWTLGTPANGATMYEGSIKKLKDNIEDLAHVADKSVQVTEQSFSTPEKTQARKNIGAISYDTTYKTTNVIEEMTRNTSLNINMIKLGDDYVFWNDEIYHLFLHIPSEIQLANYSKNKAQIWIHIGGNNFNTAPFKMKLRSDVEDGTLKIKNSFIPIDWVCHDIDSDWIDSLRGIVITFHDNDNDDMLNMVQGQSLSFILRGTATFVEVRFGA